jgi:hypothetical protein
MALTLQVVSYLFGLSIVGEVVGAIDAPGTWKAGLSDHFVEMMVPSDR